MVRGREGQPIAPPAHRAEPQMVEEIDAGDEADETHAVEHDRHFIALEEGGSASSLSVMLHGVGFAPSSPYPRLAETLDAVRVLSFDEGQNVALVEDAHHAFFVDHGKLRHVGVAHAL